ncbi:MAG TPA: hypothetical protein PKI93_02785 [Alphaproteobacteria bacterium]|nr:hypothetical protein [Alphaproteobacteria bacterium]HNS43903.1 hypothetical protein [Alphaproteobacteria bacterium]
MTYSWGAIFFLTGLAVYALFGSPTPDHYGWPEYVVGLLLLLAVRFPDLKRDGILLGCAAGGFFIPALIGAVHGAVFTDIVRDMVPFLFLFLVAVYRPHIEELGIRFVWFVAGMGFVFSVRALVPVWSELIQDNVRMWGAPPDLLYLANSPEVLFAALWLMGAGFASLFYDIRILRGLVLVVLSLIPLLSMVMMMQRAGAGAYAASLLILLFGLLVYSPKRFAVAILCLAGVVVAVSPLVLPVVDALVWKTHLVGFNSRVQEWGKVLDLVSQDWVHALFGYGWGARFENPAVGGISVLYTHSLPSSLLLKTGWLGTGIVITGLGMSLARALPDIFGNRRLFWALVFPFLIAAGIYASYKSLGFGLILLIFFAYRHQKLERDAPPVA